MYKSVSIIIPCRNEEKYIEECVNSILTSNYPRELITIYVCDGLSTDKTPEIVSQIASENVNVFLLNNKKRTTPFALNLGLKKSTADIKIILGAHSTIDKDFIKENVNTFNIETQIGCTGGIINNIYENDTAKIIGLAMSTSFGVGNAHFRTAKKDGFVDTVAFGAYKNEVFEKIGYFDESLTRNQDDEFNYRMIKNGFKIYLNRKIQSNYYVRGSFNKLFSQYFQYGYWKIFVNKKHKIITTLRQVVPSLFVLFIIFGGILSCLHRCFLYAYLTTLSIYFISAFISAISLKENVFKLVYCFLILHVSYGLGYILGILDFLILNKQPSKKSEQLTR